MRPAHSLLAFALATCLAQVARAEDVEKARKLFADGVRLYQTGDYEGARRLFREADAEHHAAAIVYNLGLAEEKLGHPQAAVDAYEAFVGEAGANNDLTPAAVAAIAQIKARSTRLRVETKPPGVRVFVDGAALTEPAPVTLLVTGGHHVVVAQGDGWRKERDLEAKGDGAPLTVTLEADVALTPPPTDPTPSSPPAIDTVPSGPSPARPLPAVAEPSELVWGASFAFVPAYMFGVTTPNAENSVGAPSIVAGPLLEVGYALTERFEFMGRALLGLGPDGKPTYAWMGGPGLSVNIAPRVWIGATFIGGQLESKGKGLSGTKVRFGTDIVFGTMAEIGVVILKKPAGEWIAGVQPSFLLTEMRNDNTTLFFPVTFGYRAY